MPWNADMPWNDFEEVLADELEQYITGAQLPPGIAANLALMENFFCIAVCMQIKTPLIIVGTPGMPLHSSHLRLHSCFALLICTHYCSSCNR